MGCRYQARSGPGAQRNRSHSAGGLVRPAGRFVWRKNDQRAAGEPGTAQPLRRATSLGFAPRVIIGWSPPADWGTPVLLAWTVLGVPRFLPILRPTLSGLAKCSL